MALAIQTDWKALEDFRTTSSAPGDLAECLVGFGNIEVLGDVVTQALGSHWAEATILRSGS